MEGSGSFYRYLLKWRYKEGKGKGWKRFNDLGIVYYRVFASDLG